MDEAATASDSKTTSVKPPETSTNSESSSFETDDKQKRNYGPVLPENVALPPTDSGTKYAIYLGLNCFPSLSRDFLLPFFS